jgi:hypothetical protein
MEIGYEENVRQASVLVWFQIQTGYCIGASVGVTPCGIGATRVNVNTRITGRLAFRAGRRPMNGIHMGSSTYKYSSICNGINMIVPM